MRAEIISIGTELLLGHITDTNAVYLAQRLSALGIDLHFVSQVGDNRGRLTETLRKAWERADVIITTGGLGPTEDDVTREAIADLLQETPQVDSELAAVLTERYQLFSSAMPATNIKQAWLIPSATSLKNPSGTAPGWFVQNDNHIIISMPGVPKEMYQMWENEAEPRLSTLAGATIFTRILRISGMGESIVEDTIIDFIHLTNPTVATYAKSDAVDVRISAKAENTAKAREMVDDIDAQIRSVLGSVIFGEDKDTLASVAGDLLKKHGWTMSVMESCTGGLTASTITDIPGSSDYMRGGIVAYATDLKKSMGVPADVIEQHGVISRETALEMARASRLRCSSDVGIGITGVAGPDLQEGKPVGLVFIAIVTPETEVAEQFQMPGDRHDIKRRAALRALNMLRLALSSGSGN